MKREKHGQYDHEKGQPDNEDQQDKPSVFDADIEHLMQLALQKPSNDSNIVGLGAMWLAAELYCLQERQRQEQEQEQKED